MTREDLIKHITGNGCQYVKRVGSRSIYKNIRNNKPCGIDDNGNPDAAYVYWVCKTLMIDQPHEILDIAKDLDGFDREAEKIHKK